MVLIPLEDVDIFNLTGEKFYLLNVQLSNQFPMWINKVYQNKNFILWEQRVSVLSVYFSLDQSQRQTIRPNIFIPSAMLLAWPIKIQLTRCNLTWTVTTDQKKSQERSSHHLKYIQLSKCTRNYSPSHSSLSLWWQTPQTLLCPCYAAL